MAKSRLINGTPTGLIPKVGEYSVQNTATYQQLLITDAPAEAHNISQLEEQLDPFAANHESATDDMPAVGVLLTFEQGWYQKGVALGELRKSITLAPGEVTKVATVDWRRATRSVDESERTQQEITSAETDDASSANSVQQGVFEETTRGMSVNASASKHSEHAASGGGLFWGASTSGGSNSHVGMNAAASTGTRDASTSSLASIQQRTEQHAQAARATRATQIREVTEDEQQTTSVRVLANYNHAHALTMQYYEVLQIYSVETRVVRADRCIFVPMDVMSFTKENMDPAIESPDPNRGQFTDRMIELLRRTLRELGMHDLDELVGLQREGSFVPSRGQAASSNRRASAIQETATEMSRSEGFAWVQGSSSSGRASAIQGVATEMSRSEGFASVQGSSSSGGVAAQQASPRSASESEGSSGPLNLQSTEQRIDIGLHKLTVRVFDAQGPLVELAAELQAAAVALAALKKGRNEQVLKIQELEEQLATVERKRSEQAAILANSSWRFILGDAQIEAMNAADPVLQQLAADRTRLEAEVDKANSQLGLIAAERAKLEGVQARTEAERLVAEQFLEREVALLEAYPRVFGLLEKQKLLLNQQMWMRIDAHTWHGLLADYDFPAAADVSASSAPLAAGGPTATTEQDHEYAGQPIGGMINPEPIGFFGNYVAFMWDFPPVDTPGQLDPAVEFERRYINNSHKSASKTTTHTTISLPTEGMFAEAVLGRSNAAEKIDLTRFWNWQDSLMPIRPPEMGPVGAGSRARDVLLPKALDFETAIAQLQSMPAEDLNDDSKLLAALRNSVGPDLRALSKAATDASTTAATHAAEGADRAQQRTIEHQQNIHGTVVGLANSEVVKTAGAALGGGEGIAGMLGGAGGGSAAGGGLSSLGGLINQAQGDGGDEGGSIIDLAKKAASAVGGKKGGAK